MGDIDMAALRAAAESATPGPWDLDEVYEVWSQDADGQGHLIAATKYQDEDATYIAAANPAVVLALLDRLAMAEAGVDRVRAMIPQTLDDHGEDGEGCVCGWRWPEDDEGPNYDAHLAGALLAAIATEETR